MISQNPVFKKPEWAEKVQDWMDPEGAEARKLERGGRREEERRTIEELRLHAFQQLKRERQAQALIQNQRPEFVEQNLGQWIRQIEEDERMRMGSD
jgi:hypothetical protein